MIYGNPNEMAILIEPIIEWSDDTFTNGLLFIFLKGEMFPSSQNYKISTLNLDICDFKSEILQKPRDNKEYFFASKQDFFKKAISMSFPREIYSDCNGDFAEDLFIEDYSYILMIDSLIESSCYICIVGYKDQVRIVAAETSYLTENDDGNKEWEKYDNPAIYELFLKKSEFCQLIMSLGLATK